MAVAWVVAVVWVVLLDRVVEVVGVVAAWVVAAWVVLLDKEVEWEVEEEGEEDTTTTELNTQWACLETSFCSSSFSACRAMP